MTKIGNGTGKWEEPRRFSHLFSLKEGSPFHCSCLTQTQEESWSPGAGTQGDWSVHMCGERPAGGRENPPHITLHEQSHPTLCRAPEARTDSGRIWRSLSCSCSSSNPAQNSVPRPFTDCKWKQKKETLGARCHRINKKFNLEMQRYQNHRRTLASSRQYLPVVAS